MLNHSEANQPARKLVPHFARIATYAMFPVVLAASAVAANSPSRTSDAGTPIPRITVTARDFAYEAPDTVSAGHVEIVLKNLGPDLHHVQLMRLEGNHTLGDLMTAVQHGAPPKWAVEAGGPNTPAPGAESRGIVKLRAGRYAIICVIPAPDGVPHIMKGMARELIVRPNAKPAPAPTADIKMTLSDYAFTYTKPISAGKHMIAVSTNISSPQAHEVFFVKLAAGKKVEDALKWIEKADGPTPMTLVGGTTGMAPEETMYVPMEFTPGEYAMLCFIPDIKDKKPHIMHGMVQTFTVK